MGTKKAEIIEHCGNCRYEFEEVCRRFPPTWRVFTDRNIEVESKSEFPDVSEIDWCGEWEGK